MKHAFRLGFILIPFLFLVSTTAYPSESVAQFPRGHKHKVTRSPASFADPSVKISDLSARQFVSHSQSSVAASQMSYVNDMRSATPPIGRGVGVQAPVLRFY